MGEWASRIATMLHAIGEVLASARLPYVAAAIALYAFSVPIGAWRWQTVLRGLGREAPLGRLILTNLAAVFINNLTPSSRLAGEACRVVTLVRSRIAVTSTAVVSIIYERISEAPVVGALVLIAVFVAGRGLRSLPGPAGALAVLAAVAALAFAATRIVPWARQRIRESATGVLTLRVFAFAVIGSAGIWGLDVIRLRTAAAAVGTEVSLAQAATLAAITIAAGLVPSLGGLGVVEGGLVGGLIAFGVAPAEAAAITAIERGISYGLASVVGAAALSTLGGRAVWAAMQSRQGVAES